LSNNQKGAWLLWVGEVGADLVSAEVNKAHEKGEIYNLAKQK
jgi:hypothetical protein